MLAWGGDAGRARLVLGTNAPYNAVLPCAGVWMLRPGGGEGEGGAGDGASGEGAGRALLRSWWDTPAHDTRHAYEQDALWGLLARWEARACPHARFTNASIAVVGVPQFPAGAHPPAGAGPRGEPLERDRYGEFSEDAWLHHTQEYWMGGRRAIMARRLRELGVGDGEFADLIDRIQRQHTAAVDVLDAAVEMHLLSCAEGPLEEPCSTYLSQ